MHCAELLAQLHDTPLEPFRDHVERFIWPGSADETVEQRLHRLLARWNEYRTQIEHLPSPLQTFAFDWLRRNIPRDARRPVRGHGGFGIHNMLSVGARIRAGRECSDFGATEQDLEWIQPHVSEHMSWHKFLEHYHACGGPEVRDDDKAFYGLWGMTRPFLASERATRNLQTGENKDSRYVMCELGFTNAFFRMMLDVMRTDEQKAVVENNAGDSAKAKL